MAKQCNADKIFIDKLSGKTMDNRTQLQQMLSFVREGDEVICESLSRLGRSTKDLIQIANFFKEHKITLKCLKENIELGTPVGDMVFVILSSIQQMERETIALRCREGIAIAKARGVYKGRKPKKIDEEKFKAMCYEWRQGKRTATSIIKAFDIAASTFYDWVKIKNL